LQIYLSACLLKLQRIDRRIASHSRLAADDCLSEAQLVPPASLNQISLISRRKDCRRARTPDSDVYRWDVLLLLINGRKSQN